MATFLTLTNELLRELNEVALTSSTFANAIGVQQHAKDCINRGYLGVSGEVAPHTIRNIKFTTTEEWKDFFRVSQNKDASDTQQYGVPSRVIRSPDSRKFGLSAIPDKVYRIWFYAYDLPTELDAFGDAIVFADTYKPVLLARARYYMHQFKENSQAAAFALEDYKRGLKLMRLHLMEPAPGYFKDDRMRFV